MRVLTFLQPTRLVIGSGCLSDAAQYLQTLPAGHVHVITSPSNRDVARRLTSHLPSSSVDTSINTEPSLSMFYASLATAEATSPACIVGLGGGSPLDVAKLVAAFVNNEQRVEDTFGIGLLASRKTHLVCLPTTSGAGSEVSPNAILLDASGAKKGVVSSFLVPDATFIDAELTLTVPAAVTAATGLDALTHCLEAFTNKHAHPLSDVYALEGMRLVARFLPRAVRDGNDLEAREAMSRASYYGGLCLGPVNTAAVHALAYPLGGQFGIAHGLSNAVLLAAVFRFNAEAAPERHAAAALALGAKPGVNSVETAMRGAGLIEELTAASGVETDLSRLGVSREAIPQLAAEALTVQRLLQNNPREVTLADAERIYEQCLRS